MSTEPSETTSPSNEANASAEPREMNTSSQPEHAEPPPEAKPVPAPAPAQGDDVTSAAAPAAHEAAGESEGEGEGEDDADGAEASEEGAEARGETGAPGDAPKKKRRRRRKKKKPGEGATAEGATPGEGGEAPAGEGAEGAHAEGHAPGQGEHGRRERREKKDKEPRERPAFNVGDVVFGKVLEVTEDALLVDLSGKAKAIFDLRELLIPEDADHGPDPDDAEEAEGEHAPIVIDASNSSQHAEATGESASQDQGAHAHAHAPGAEVAKAEAATETTEEVAEVPTSVSSTAIVSSGATEASTPVADHIHTPGTSPGEEATHGEEKQPTLPRVILEPGAPFVGVVHNDGGRGGLVVLTHHPKRVSKAKPIVSAAFRDKTMVWGLVTGAIKGGVEVDVEGLRAFTPGSHMDMRPGADLSPYIGKRFGFAVTQYGKRGRDVVLSRRSVIEAEAKTTREEALAKVQVGSIVEGMVRTVVAFGAFVDVGGVEGLVPLAEMSHNRADQPRDVFKVGETTRVKIMRIDEKGKLWLSHKATLDDPWGEVAIKYAQGTKHKGVVARIQPFGAFVELENGIDGLIHAADLSFKRFENVEDIVKVGQEIEVVVAQMDSSRKKIGLHPALTGDAAIEEPQRVQVQKSLKVKVVSVETGGLAVRILGLTGRLARGFITAGGTGTPRGTELKKLFPPGKELEAKVVEMDPKRSEIKLSIKAHHEDNERSAYQAYRAQVKREAKFGTFADLLQKSLKKDES